jgi:hypothetical protein
MTGLSQSLLEYHQRSKHRASRSVSTPSCIATCARPDCSTLPARLLGQAARAARRPFDGDEPASVYLIGIRARSGRRVCAVVADSGRFAAPLVGATCCLRFVRHRPEADRHPSKIAPQLRGRVKDCAMSALLLGSRTHAPLDDGARWNIHIHQLLYFCIRNAHPRSTCRAGLTLPDCGKRGLIKRSVALSTGDPVGTHGGSLLKLWRMNSTKQRHKQDSETICRHFPSKASNRFSPESLVPHMLRAMAL